MNGECVRVFGGVPADIATALYYTGIDPFTKEQVIRLKVFGIARYSAP